MAEWYDIAEHAFEAIVGWVYSTAVDPLIYSLGLMSWAERAFDGTSFLVAGVLQVIATVLVCIPLERLAPVQAYEAYYRRWDKSYHVLLQVESVALKGKPVPSVAALVEAMFMAELRNMLLTAGHDARALMLPLTLGVAAGGERFVGIRGREEVLKAGDMMIADGAGIISSVLCGPDARTKITPATTAAVFTVYAPPGIEAGAVAAHLNDIAAFVRLAAPAAKVTALEVIGGAAGG